MTGPTDTDPSWPRLIEILRQTYTDRGIAIWLEASNAHLHGASPLDLIQMGDLAAVVAVAERIEGGVMTNPKPTPRALWKQAKSPEEYRQLMIEHGHMVDRCPHFFGQNERCELPFDHDGAHGKREHSYGD